MGDSKIPFPKCMTNFLFILAAYLALRLSLLWIPIVDVDEAIYALFAKVWFSGGIPYIDCVETKPLGIYFLYGVIHKIFGHYNMLAVHIFTILWMFATGCILYLIVRLFGSKRAGLFAALFYGVFTTTYTPKIIATTIEPIMMLPIALHIYLWLKYEGTRSKNLAFLSGVALSMALVLKYQAGIHLVLLPFYLFIIHPVFIKDTPFVVCLKGLFHFLMGLLPIPAVMLLYLYNVDALDGFIFWTLKGSMDYITGGSNLIDVPKQILTRFLPFVVASGVLWWLMARRLKDIFKASTNRNEWLIFAWFLFSFAPVAAGSRFYGHYFIIIVPALSIIAAHQLDLWLEKGTGGLAKGIVVAAILIPAIGCLVPRFFTDRLYKMTGEDNPKDYKPIAAYVEAHTTQGERIAVWGFAPLIYWDSGRLPATRFFWSDLLVGRVPALKIKRGEAMSALTPMQAAWEMFFSDLERHKPVYFIDTSPAALHDYEHFPVSKYPRLADYLAANYKEEANVGGTLIYRRMR